MAGCSLTKHLSCALLAALLALAAGGAAQAGSLSGNSYSNKYYQKHPTGILIALKRADGLAPRQFILSLSAKDAVTGCARLGNLGFESAFSDIYLNIKIDAYTVDMRNPTATPPAGCDRRYQVPKAEIILSLDDLAAHKTQHIRFKTGMFTDNFVVDLGDNSIQISPAQNGTTSEFSRYQPQKIPHVKNPLSLWFYPEGTLILYAPDAPGGLNLRPYMDELAAQSGLVPLESALPGFTPPVDTPYVFYYLDKEKRLAATPGIDGGVPAGKIMAQTKFYGLKGDELTPRTLNVMARTPGLYE